MCSPISNSSLSSSSTPSSSSSSTPSLSYVNGIRFQTRVMGIGAPGFILNCIFIPSMDLEISDRAPARRTKTNWSNPGKCKSGDKEFDKLSNEANKKAKEEIQIPLDLAKSINDLVEKDLALEATKKEIHSSIADLAKKLF